MKALPLAMGGGLRLGCVSTCLNFSGLIDINDHSKPNPNMKEAQPHWISKFQGHLFKFKGYLMKRIK